jgi:ubiquinone/menaquinone biosynthesis C-methylase UbiE
LGHSIHHSNNLWEFWESLAETVIKGSPQDPGNDYLDEYPHRLEDYLSAMNETGELKAATIADIIAIGDFRKMLDIGCGPGTYALEFSQRNPDLSATLIDLDPNLQYARERITDSTVQDRITTLTCQVLEENIPGSGYDLVFISNLIHIYDKAEVGHILSKAWNVLSTSGSMVIHDYIIGVTGSKPLFTSLFDLTMFLGTPRGRCYDREELGKILDHLGARRQRFIPLKLGTSLLMAEK